MRKAVTDTPAVAATARRKIHLTKEIAIWSDLIERVYPAPDGGSFIVTDRGTTKVSEPADQILAFLADNADFDGREVR